MIDRNSPLPVYYQVQNDLVERINRKEWKINDLLPSENSLIKEYGVSRVTLRQALAELEKDKIIERSRGKRARILGTKPNPFVHKLNYKLATLDSSDGNEVTAKVLEKIEVSPVYISIKNLLKLSDDNDRAIFIKRIFYLNKRPIAICKSWLPSCLLPGFLENDMINNSLSDTLEKSYSIKAKTVDDVFEVVRSSQSESTLLKCSLDVPLLLIKGLSAMEDGTPLEYSETAWLGDAVKFRFHLTNSDKGFFVQNEIE